jgi:hypothetical protein
MASPKSEPELPNPWPFEAAPDTVCVTTNHIVHEGCPVLYASRDEADGTWQFHYGGPVSMSDALLVAIQTVFFQDPSIVEIADLPLGWWSERAQPGAQWKRTLRARKDE